MALQTSLYLVRNLHNLSISYYERVLVRKVHQLVRSSVL